MKISQQFQKILAIVVVLGALALLVADTYSSKLRTDTDGKMQSYRIQRDAEHRYAVQSLADDARRKAVHRAVQELKYSVEHPGQ
jgi:ribosomal protein S11